MFERAALLWKHSSGYWFLYRWTRKSLDSFGRFSWGGQGFGNLNYLRGALESHLAGAQGKIRNRWRWLLDYELAQTHGEARGRLETWPFTTTLIDLLGPRYTGKAVMDARWTRVHSGLEATWRNRIVSQLGIAELQLAAVSMGWRFGFAGFDWDFAIRQFVPVHSEEVVRAASSEPDAGAPDEDPPPSSASSHGWKWPGGTLLEFTLVRGL